VVSERGARRRIVCVYRRVHPAARLEEVQTTALDINSSVSLREACAKLR
jgi:hypothetical protein